MKARTLVSVCLIFGLAAAAQTAPPSQKVAPEKAKSSAMQAAPAKAAPAKQAPAVAKTAAAPAKAATMQAKPAAPAKPVAAAPKAAAPKAAPKPVAKAPARAPAKAAPAKQAAKAPSKRDPFVSPVRAGGPGGPDCAVGKKCLAIDAILLRGIVRAPSGSIAVVESSTRKVTYFLRENDPVFNGYVVKITADSVMFRENVVDRLGQQSTRDVVKRVNAPPV